MISLSPVLSLGHSLPHVRATGNLAKVKTIFESYKKLDGVPSDVTLVVVRGKIMNAWSGRWNDEHSGYLIKVTKGMVNTGNVKFYEAILAHEFGHIINGNYDNNPCGKGYEHRKCEIAADMKGQELMARAGYNPCDASSDLKADKDHAQSKEYPSNKERVAYLDKDCHSYD